MTTSRLACHGLVLALTTSTLACRNQVQPPTLPVAAPEVTRGAPKPQPIDPKRDTKHKAMKPRVSDAAKPLK